MSDLLKRPLGVTILGVYFALNGAFQLLSFFIFPSLVFLLILLFSILNVIVAFGLLLGEEWTWKLTLVLNFIYLILTIAMSALSHMVGGLTILPIFVLGYPVYFFFLWLTFHPFFLIAPTTIVIPLFILPFVIFLYLMLPHVKAFFLGS